MYRCKECGTEYEVKPDYCDCGNDEFEDTEVNIDISTDVNVLKTNNNAVFEIQSDKKSTNIEHSDISYNAGQAMPDKNLNYQHIPHPVYANYKNEQRFSANASSWIIFCLCLLLSFYVMFFAWNPKEIANNISKTKEETTPVNIPSIEKIWNNAVPVQKKTEPEKQEIVQNIIKQIIPESRKIVPQKIEQKVQTKSVQKKADTKVQKKTTVVPLKNSTTSTKTAQTIKQQSTSSVQDTVKQKAEQERLKAEEEQIKKLKAEQAKKAAEEKAKQDAAAKQELASYKANLRNTIGRKIDFTKVIGDGSCTVSFKIDTNGKLISRSFSKQSSNNTLNDAVYNAVMSTPTFSPPPSAYKNETLNLNIKFYNGNFEISLP